MSNKKKCRDCTFLKFSEYCGSYCTAKTGKILWEPIEGNYEERLSIPVYQINTFPNKTGDCCYFEKSNWRKIKDVLKMS